MRWWKPATGDQAPYPSNVPTAVPATASLPDRGQRSEWRQLGPAPLIIQRMAPIAPLDPFVVSLATSHNPSFLASLGHLVNPTGPHGEVTGLAASGTPRTVHTGPELAVAAKPTTMQRVAQRIAAAPRMLFGQTLSAQGERPRSDEEHTIHAGAPVATPHPPTEPAAQRSAAADPGAGADHAAADPGAGADHAAADPGAVRSAAGARTADAPSVDPVAAPTPTVMDLPVVARAAAGPSTAQSHPLLSLHPAAVTEPPAAPIGAVSSRVDVDAAPNQEESIDGGTVVAGAAEETPASRVAPLVGRAAEAAVPADPEVQRFVAGPSAPEPSPASLSAPTTPTTPTAPEGTGARNARPGLDLGPLLSAPTSPPVQRVPHDLTGHRAATVVAVPDLVALPTTVPLLVARSAGRSDGAVQLGANATVSLGDTASPGPGATTAPLPGRAATDSASAASSAPLVGLSHLMRALDPTGAGITGEAESTGDAGDARAAPETRAARAPAEPPTSAGPDLKVMSAGVSPSPATRRPGLGAPIATDTMIQRSVVATSFDVGATPVRASSPHLAVPHLSTHPLLGRGMSESPTPIALDEVFAGPTPSPRDTSPRATSPRATAQRDAEPTIAPQDAPELVLPHRRAPQPSATAGSTSPVAQRVADRTAYQQTAAQGAEQMADQSAVRDTGAASAPTHADPAGEPTVAPLLSDTGLTVLTAGALPPTAAAPAGEGSVATVRRIGTGVGSGTATASISQPFSTRDASAVVQRTPAVRGLGAPMVTPSAPAQHDPVTVRTMSLQRMFDPGTAAITSGVTRPHSDTSVGFEPSVPTPLIVTGHRDATAQRSADPSSAGQAIRTAEPVGSDVVSRYSSEAAGVVSRSLVDEHRTPAAVQTAMDAPSAPPPVAAPAGGVAGLPTDLDELARRLFDPLSARLKSELWMDRERAGMVTDLRR